jgi:hypothetical protein
MPNKITRRQMLKTGGFMAGFTAANGIPALANLLAPASVNAQTTASRTMFEFVGPFPSWSNLKRDFGAVGNGIADDTQALQKALDRLKADKAPKVLYLPAGTYRITKMLVMTSHIDVAIVGENPSNTKIKWDGPKDGIMLYMNGVRYSRLARLTFDGSAKAIAAIDQSWDNKVPGFDTANEYLDNTFQDVGYGIHAGGWGHGGAESAVIGCTFLRNSQAGIITKNFNALDWFIWYSTFRDCKVGVTNDPGAGNFHVFSSIFQNSKEADIKIANTLYFSIRNNFSYNSKAFFVANSIGQNGAQITLQGNRIIHTVDTAAINIGNLGPVLLIDNIIKSRVGVTSPAIQYTAFTAVDLVSIGNSFTVNNPINVSGRFISIDDRTISHSQIDVNKPALPGVMPKRGRRVFEVPVGSSGEAIQNIINTASKLKGSRPVVHFPPGDYRVEKTIVIPAGSDVQLVGDGYNSVLSWFGGANGPVLRLAGPSKAILRDLRINGGTTSHGIVVENADQPGAMVFAQQVYLDGSQQHNLLVDKLDNTKVELHNFYHSECQGTSLKVIGGLLASQGRSVPGKTNLFAGASSNSNLSYSVTNGGKLLVRDIWYESNHLPKFIQLTGNGTFTFQGGRIAAPADRTSPAVEISKFSGKATFLSSIIDDRISVSGVGSSSSVLAMGMQGTGDNYLRSTNATSALLYSRKYQQGSYPVPNQGNVTDTKSFIRTMLQHARAEQPTRAIDIASGITDVRLYRVRVHRTLTGIILKK